MSARFGPTPPTVATRSHYRLWVGNVNGRKKHLGAIPHNKKGLTHIREPSLRPVALQADVVR